MRYRQETKTEHPELIVYRLHLRLVLLWLQSRHTPAEGPHIMVGDPRLG